MIWHMGIQPAISMMPGEGVEDAMHPCPPFPAFLGDIPG